MSRAPTRKKIARWSLPDLDRSGPVRGFGAAYRTSDDPTAGLAGVPLTTAEDAVVAAVRMAYRVADAQVDRSTRLAMRLRDAGDRAAGPQSDVKALNAVDGLANRAFLAFMGWLQTGGDPTGLLKQLAGAEAGDADGGLLRRLLVAQYRLAGAALGLGDPAAPSAPAAKAASGEAAPAPSSAFRGRMQLTGEPRPVGIRRWDIQAPDGLDVEVRFYSVQQLDAEPLTGRVTLGAGPPSFAIAIARDSPLGLWKAAVCDAASVQLGVIEIEL